MIPVFPFLSPTAFFTKVPKKPFLVLLVLAVFLSRCPAQRNTSGKPADTILFQYPMKIAPEISGSFGELRATHFHGGMDFRTLQREGIKVYSIAPGRITGADVSKVSYGKALYVKHPNGMVSLYAHLSSFHPKVRRKVRKEQRRSRNDEIRLRNLDIPVHLKRPIARSGNSGSSGGPHLHLEIRQGEDRLNPACLGLSVPDRIPPEIHYLAFYHYPSPASPDRPATAPDPDSCMRHCFMDAPRQDLRMYRVFLEQYDSLRAEMHSSRHSIRPNPQPELRLETFFSGRTDAVADYYPVAELPDTLWAEGPCAFGLCALDKIQDMPFHYGLYELAFRAREQVSPNEGPVISSYDTLACYRLDRITESVYGEIALHIDTGFLNITGKRLEKGWISPGQTATPYGKLSAGGILRPNPGSFYEIDIRARDFAGNESRICFILGSQGLGE